mmetsp:Transcript_13903/g.43594  ORF Transcript_13903/g.43594 Transcript_13903/m.43594 type:complete len:358 (-) Transcript_13903:621-1694(-)
MVDRVFLTACLGLFGLVLTVLLEVLLRLFDLHLQPGLWVVHGLLQVIDAFPQVINRLLFVLHLIFVLLLLVFAPVKLLLVHIALLHNDFLHLLDGLQDLGERVAKGQQGCDAGKPLRVAGVRGPLQQAQHRSPGFCLSVDRVALRCAALHGGELQEACRPRGGRVNLSEGAEGLVVVQDGDRLGDSSLLVCAEQLPGLPLLGLLLTLLGELSQEFLVVFLILLGPTERGLLLGEFIIVVGECLLLPVVGLLHGLELFLLCLYQLLVCLLCRLLCGLCRLQVGLKGLLHCAQDAEDGAGLCRVGTGEGCLQECSGLQTLLGRQEGVRCDQGLLHAVTDLQQGLLLLLLVVGHELLVFR